MTNRIDNEGRIVHAETGIVLGIRGPGADTYFPTILAQSAVPISLTGTTAETVLASVTIPGGMMGPNGILRLSALWSTTNNANNKFLRAVFGGSYFLSYIASTSLSEQLQTLIRNRGSQSSQVGVGAGVSGIGASGSAVATSALDTSVDQVLTFRAQLASAADTITLEGYTVEVLPGA